ncbi:MAG TPA: pyridoxamine 5'-phosphate oxidase family protein [Methanocella sp.]|nr:pyridoxamine 5'-phosphate oxidase family protein [Methanocella sp.]
MAFDLMKTAKAAYLTTIDENDYPETRAMLNLRNSDKYPKLSGIFNRNKTDFSTYFTTNTSSPKMRRIEANSKACVYYSKPDEWRGLMMAGDLEPVEDAEVKSSLWQSSWTMYYPAGPTDPDYAILRLRPSFLQGYHQLEHYHIDTGDV